MQIKSAIKNLPFIVFLLVSYASYAEEPAKDFSRVGEVRLLLHPDLLGDRVPFGGRSHVQELVPDR